MIIERDQENKEARKHVSSCFAIGGGLQQEDRNDFDNVV
jgi:hypothetical protein